MKNNIFSFLLIIFSLTTSAQEQRITIYGNIKSDIKQLEDIHVLNKNSKEGTITDTKGDFQILATKNDTLIFSGIQFYYLEIALTKQNIDNKTITVDLFQKINVLNEVTVKHNLTGNLLIDAGNIKDSISKVKDGALDFSNIDYSLVSTIVNESSRSHTSNDQQLMPNMSPNIIAIALLIIKPIVKQVAKIGATKRNIKNQKRIYAANILNAPEKIRIDFGNLFFTETLNIPKEHIEDFIEYCLPKGIANLYVDNKKIELIQLLLEESNTFNNQIKNEN